jgi:hypothetical protein
MEGKMFVKTANSSARIKGKGTIIMLLSTGEAIRISPVYYIPELNCQLLSMGTFLQDGFISVGTKNSIRIVKGNKPFLTFTPKGGNGSVYVLKSLIPNGDKMHDVVNTIYGIDYEIMHRRLAHPSKEVLLRGRKHLKDFPEIEFPKEE